MSAGGSVADVVLPPGSQDFSAQVSRNFLEASRENIGIPPRNGQDGYGWNGNRVISIPVPPGQNWVDWKNTHIMATISTTGTAGDERRSAAAGGMSYIRRATFRVQGGKDIEIRDSINLVTAVLAKFYSHEWLRGVGRRFGYGTKTQRQADATYVGPDGISGKRIELDTIALGIIESGRALPNYAVGYEFEFRLEDPLIAMVASTGSPNYAFNNVQMYTEIVTGTSFLDDDIYAMWNEEVPLTIPFRETEYFPQELSVHTALTQKNFSVAKEQVILYMMRLILQSSMTDQNADVMALNVNPGVNTVQLQIGGQLVPPSRISGTGGGAEMLAAAHNGAFRSEIPQSADGLDGDAFQSNPPVGGTPSQTSQNMVVIGLGGGQRADIDAGLNLNLGNSQAYFRLQLIAGLNLSCSMMQFVTYVSHLNLFPNQADVRS